MNRMIAILAAGAVVAMTTAASAQNLPAPGNVRPGSMNSGAEQTGASNQPRSPGWDNYYGGYSYGMPAYRGAQGYYSWPQGGAPVHGGGYYDQ